jgi:hypothetical protein
MASLTVNDVRKSLLRAEEHLVYWSLEAEECGCVVCRWHKHTAQKYVDTQKRKLCELEGVRDGK